MCIGKYISYAPKHQTLEEVPSNQLCLYELQEPYVSVYLKQYVISFQSIISVIHVKVIKKQQGVINVWKEREHIWKVIKQNRLSRNY